MGKNTLEVAGRVITVPWALLNRGLIFADGATSEARLQALQARRTELVEESEELIAAADNDNGRDLTDEEMERSEEINAEVSKLDKQIKARELARPVGTGRKTTAEPAGSDGKPANGSAARTRPQDVGKHGFKSFGEFAKVVRGASLSNPIEASVQVLRNAATTYGNESVGAEGGFLVPPDFAREIWAKVMAEENLLARCASLQTSGNSMTIPKDETTPWQSTGGIQVYWENEAAAIPASKPSFEQSTIRLVKLTALVPISDEAMEDAVGLESWLRAKAPAKMAAKINTAIISGNGVGQPLGILNATSLVTVSKESGPQTADTVVFPNISKMWSRMYAQWRRNSVWLINQDVEPQLTQLAFLASAASPVPAYLPANGLSASPYSTLMGRPVVPLEACSAIGDVGDILLVDFNQYWALTKAAGIKTDTSIHLYFDQSLTTFRFVFRMNGMPAWSSAITRQNGSNTLSWAVALEAR